MSSVDTEITSGAGRGERGAILDPLDRNSEVLFGLFMVLTFTGTLSVASAGRDDVRTMLIGAIGCNIAWGFVDAVMYVLRNLVERGRQATLMRAVHAAASPHQAHRLIADEISGLAEGLGATALEHVRQWLVAQPLPPARPTLTALDLRGAFLIFLMVFASTFPVVLPFIFIADVTTAKRVSAAVAIAMLYLCGHGWGRYAGLPAWRTGVTMVLLGAVVEAIVIALGG
jgi:VIT1/CCC1 family predicted Fe2+/Mn2+ transporter